MFLFFFPFLFFLKVVHGGKFIAIVDDEITNCDYVTENVRGHSLRCRALFSDHNEIKLNTLKGTNDCFISFESDALYAQKVLDEIYGVNDVVEDIEININELWNLDRLDQPDLPYNGKMIDTPWTGKGENVYILDTGLFKNHQDFTGRAFFGKDFTSENDVNDKHGHGTHCASSAVGTTYGVAKEARAIGIKVLNSGGTGSLSGVIQGIQYAVKDAGTKTSVLSLSLGSISNKALDKAVKDAAKLPIVVVAAGNSNDDACKYSPAGNGGSFAKGGISSITVGSLDRNDRRSSFSNYGTCVDIWAPGSSILGAWIYGTRDSKLLSGTSMAAPHVAGVCASLLQKHSGDMKLALNELFQISAKNKIGDVKVGSPNLLLQVPKLGNPPKNPTQQPTLAKELKLKFGNENVEFMMSKFGPDVTKNLTSNLYVAKTKLCDDYKTESSQMRGKIALVSRGDCSFIDKTLNAQELGAIALIIHQDSNAIPFSPVCASSSDRCSQSNIPSAMIYKKNRVESSIATTWALENTISFVKCRQLNRSSCRFQSSTCKWRRKKCRFRK